MSEKKTMSSRNKNFLFNVIIFAITIALVVVAAYLGGRKDFTSRVLMVVYFALGALAAGLVHVFIHEIGHLIAGRIHKMKVAEIRFFFFDFKKINGKIHFSFTSKLSTAGETVMVPVGTENMLKRYKGVALGGIMGSLVWALIGIAGMAVVDYVPAVAYAFTSMVLPIAVYNLLSNAMPMFIDGAMNDGAVVDGARKKTDTVAVAARMLEVEAELYAGKTYGEIDKSVFFDLPQLPEDDLMYTVLLSNRYNYYLDSGDTENALKTSDRLYSLLEYMPKFMKAEVKKDFLYDACALKLNENDADDLADELEKNLNSDNSARGLRVKAAYLLYVLKNYPEVPKFLEGAKKAAKKEMLKGIGLFEAKLIGRMEEKVEEIAKTPMPLDEQAENAEIAEKAESGEAKEQASNE